MPAFNIMLNFFQNLTKSKADRQAEQIAAYLDRALSPQARREFEQTLAGNADLQAELRQQQAIKAALRQLPRHRAPRSFALDPARYGQERRAPGWQPFPVLRAATAVMALLLVAILAFDLAVVRHGAAEQPETAAMMPASQESFAVEATPVVQAEEIAADETQENVAAEEPMPASAEALTAPDESASDAAAEMEAPAAEKQPVPEPGLSMARVMTETQTMTITSAAEVAAAPTTVAPQPTSAASLSSPTTEPPSPGAIATEQPAVGENAPQASISSHDLFRLTEIFLAVGVAALALATWLARRRT
ncbi:MAG: hypothetical protein KC418_07490 [Anaerolineales bacterium]|nr:hypothetical protein [Anaerolineales bacterium]MCB8950437.1 hypothetical protein [Ardenticatenales bacterium]